MVNPVTNSEGLTNYWSLSIENLFKELDTNIGGISDNTAQGRLKKYNSNKLKTKKKSDSLTLLVAQLISAEIAKKLFYRHQQ